MNILTQLFGCKNKMVINGVDVTPETIPDNGFTVIIGTKTYNFSGDVKVEIAGDVEDVMVTTGNVECRDVKNVAVSTGDVTCQSVGRSVTVTTGDVICQGNIGGDVKINVGSIKCSGGISGNASTNIGDIKR
jgi:hypothetical protein